MTSITTRRIAVLALAPLVLMGVLRASAQTDAGFTGRTAGDARLELAWLKAEARSLTVHIDGP